MQSPVRKTTPNHTLTKSPTTEKFLADSNMLCDEEYEFLHDMQNATKDFMPSFSLEALYVEQCRKMTTQNVAGSVPLADSNKFDVTVNPELVTSEPAAPLEPAISGALMPFALPIALPLDFAEAFATSITQLEAQLQAAPPLDEDSDIQLDEQLESAPQLFLNKMQSVVAGEAADDFNHVQTDEDPPADWQVDKLHDWDVTMVLRHVNKAADEHAQLVKGEAEEGRIPAAVRLVEELERIPEGARQTEFERLLPDQEQTLQLARITTRNKRALPKLNVFGEHADGEPVRNTMAKLEQAIKVVQARKLQSLRSMPSVPSVKHAPQGTFDRLAGSALRGRNDRVLRYLRAHAPRAASPVGDSRNVQKIRFLQASMCFRSMESVRLFWLLLKQVMAYWSQYVMRTTTW